MVDVIEVCLFFVVFFYDELGCFGDIGVFECVFFGFGIIFLVYLGF